MSKEYHPLYQQKDDQREDCCDSDNHAINCILNSTPNMETRSVAIFAGAALLRLLVFVLFPNVPEFLTSRVEISTPVSSFKRLEEGLFLYQRGVSPYDGGVFHQAPLLLIIFEILPASVAFVTVDIASAIALKDIAGGLKVKSPRFRPLNGDLIAAAYLFNPFTILSCLGRSTTVFTNAAIVQAVLNAQSGNAIRSMLALAMGSYLSLYPVMLLPPILIMLHRKDESRSSSSPFLSLGYFAGASGVLMASTVLITGDFWEYLSYCYGAQITVPDLTPNVGLWWYFLIEMFDSFREFFIGVFWLHLAGYVGGMTFRLQDQPLFVVTSLLGLCAIFKPYPSITDVSIYLGFLPMYQHILPLTRYTFVAAAVLLYSTLLGPAFHYLWIYAGSGNANFFYAITLVWSLGLAILVGDTLFAVLRDEWEMERPEMKGKEVRRI